jgi:hypothetical protein
MAKFPIRLLGLVLLAVTITVPGCQALYHATTLPTLTEAIEQMED